MTKEKYTELMEAATKNMMEMVNNATTREEKENAVVAANITMMNIIAEYERTNR